jgi:hypothetical protein
MADVASREASRQSSRQVYMGRQVHAVPIGRHHRKLPSTRLAHSMIAINQKLTCHDKLLASITLHSNTAQYAKAKVPCCAELEEQVALEAGSTAISVWTR